MFIEKLKMKENYKFELEVENSPGVLERICQIVRVRGVNIEFLRVKPRKGAPEDSKIVFHVNIEEEEAKFLLHRLDKLIPVFAVKVKNLTKTKSE